MKKQVLLIAIVGLFSAGANAQLFTPQGTIQGQTGSGDVSIGTDQPDAKLHVKATERDVLLLNPTADEQGIIGGGTQWVAPEFAFRIQFDDPFIVPNPGTTFTIAPNGNTRAGKFEFNTSDQLAVRSRLAVYNNATNYLKLNAVNNASEVLWSNANNDALLIFKHVDSGAVPIRMRADGKVGVNTDYFPGNHSLYVKGSIITEGLTVQVYPWPDYVFEPDYSLMSLFDLHQHIRTYKRLPGMPSATEVAESGVEIGESVRLLTEKVEEITLYLIQLNEENALLKAEIALLKAEK